MAQTTILAHPEQIGDLASLAAQYGPFLFAILFVLFVPFIGQRWFAAIIRTRGPRNALERAATIRVYRFYWISGIVTGLILTAVSVAWYFYVQLNYILPDQSGQRLADEISKRIYEGVIRGASDDDIFVYDNTDPRYKVYIYPQRTETPLKVRFAIILTQAPPPNWSIQIEWLDYRSFQATREVRSGSLPASLEFCPAKEFTNLRFVRDGPNGVPHFDGAVKKCTDTKS